MERTAAVLRWDEMSHFVETLVSTVRSARGDITIIIPPVHEMKAFKRTHIILIYYYC